MKEGETGDFWICFPQHLTSWCGDGRNLVPFVFLSCALSYLKDNKSIEYYWTADFKSEQKQEKV